MNEVEQRLLRDRQAGLPVAPDLRYTEAAVRRRLGHVPGSAPDGALFPWVLVMTVLTLTVCLGWVLMLLGLSLWWLAGFPLMLLPMVPILLRKEHEGA